jgi:hypothetical protein
LGLVLPELEAGGQNPPKALAVLPGPSQISHFQKAGITGKGENMSGKHLTKEEKARNTRRTNLEALTKSTDERIRLDALKSLEAMYEADRKAQKAQEQAQKAEQATAQEPSPTAQEWTPAYRGEPRPGTPEWEAAEASAAALLAELEAERGQPIEYTCGCIWRPDAPIQRCQKHQEGL